MFLVILSLLIAPFAYAAAGLQPFVEGAALSLPLSDAVSTVQSKLMKGGFEVVGQYSPLKNVTVLSITSPAMLTTASETPRGGYGAALSVSLEEHEGKTYVTYMNPPYVAAGYHLASDNESVAKALANILGAEKTFGSKPRTVEQLANYQYGFGMETFNDPVDLGGYPSFSTAEQKILSRLAAKKDGVGLVYKIKIPGKDQEVFGVDLSGVKDNNANGVALVDAVDSGMPHRYAFLPYEVLLNNKEAEALNLRFRMALFFPDLPMMGGHASFFKLRSSPDAIKKVLQKAMGGALVSNSDNGFGGF
ncbi:hypothetical protein [Halothiobacillus sp.]|uniref:hypothetical protein n=1 Tax=Halothiobacillus sp. TaxID=1891311 RepID=UPI002603BE43|nr:hypothetical protein [Halothiobacillus sp.]